MLETEFLKLKYHANVESNTDEVDAEEYFNKNYKKIDANAKKVNADLIKIKEDLQQENSELANNMPWNTTSGKSIHITDSAKYSKNKLSLSGDMEEILANSTQEKSPNNPATINTVTGVQKIKQFGKNWLNKDNANTLNAYTGSKITADANSKSLYIKCKPNTTYTISRTKISNRFQVGECSELPNVGTALENLKPNSFINTLKNITITTSANAKYLVVFYSNASQNNGYTEEELRNSIQIEEDSTATEWEPYTGIEYILNLGSTQLCAIKDTDGNVVAKDRHVYRNGKWQWAKDIKKLVFNGTEAWKSTTAHEGFYRYILEINDSDLIYANPTNIYGINSHFQQRINQNHGGYEYLYMQGVSRCGNIYIQVKDIDTVEKLKTFLAEQYSKNTPVTTYFVARNTTYIDCTEKQSEILDKLYNNFKLDKGTNNIIAESSNGVGVNLESEYMQDNNLKHDKDIAELKQAIVALGGVI